MTTITVNGKQHHVDANPNMPLLWVLRDVLGLTGTKYGCGAAQCGACTIHLNGEAVGFAYESFMNELAHLADADPLEFRRQYLKDDRCQKLIDKMQEVSGWKSRKKGDGFGVAITECFASTVGEVVKISRKADGKVKIDQVWAVMDCGWYVNPDIISAQVEGAVLMALGAATIHEITFKDGLVEQRNFYDYLMPRISDMPPVEAHIMENDANAGGVGEPGLPPFAPALTEAIFDLTGKRIRKLPFKMTDI